jgi:hypothetical protein
VKHRSGHPENPRPTNNYTSGFLPFKDQHLLQHSE